MRLNKWTCQGHRGAVIGIADGAIEFLQTIDRSSAVKTISGSVITNTQRNGACVLRRVDDGASQTSIRFRFAGRGAQDYWVVPSDGVSVEDLRTILDGMLLALCHGRRDLEYDRRQLVRDHPEQRPDWLRTLAEQLPTDGPAAVKLLRQLLFTVLEGQADAAFEIKDRLVSAISQLAEQAVALANLESRWTLMTNLAEARQTPGNGHAAALFLSVLASTLEDDLSKTSAATEELLAALENPVHA